MADSDSEEPENALRLKNISWRACPQTPTGTELLWYVTVSDLDFFNCSKNAGNSISEP